MIIVLVSSTLRCTWELLALLLLIPVFQLASCALCPLAVLNLCKDSLKLGPDSIELSGLTEPLGLLSGSLV